MGFPTDKIYKFSSFTEYSVSALAMSSVWFSRVQDLNDPFEGFVSYVEPQNHDEVITQCIRFAAKSLEEKLSKEAAFDLALKRYHQNPEHFISITEQLIKEAQESQKEYLNSLSIYSTSVDIPNYPSPHYANMLMWAHYGNGFSGYCLRFSASKFYESIIELNNDNKVTWCTINYVNKLHKVNPLDFLGDAKFDYVKAILCKHEQWNYEGELRFISNSSGLHKYNPEALEAIYIGSKMPLGQRLVLIAIVKAYFLKAKIYEVKIDRTGYNVVADEIKI
ncbi:DUF2971 domain-containing protein [Vibrio vulnificus]|nr:DUF2971 domain-containing protein [Vibrio vulnificus]